jgi:hypothetical protein
VSTGERPAQRFRFVPGASRAAPNPIATQSARSRSASTALPHVQDPGHRLARDLERPRAGSRLVRGVLRFRDLHHQVAPEHPHRHAPGRPGSAARRTCASRRPKSAVRPAPGRRAPDRSASCLRGRG